MVVSTVMAGNLPPLCPLTAAVARQAGVHFSFHFPAGMIVLTVMAGNLAACARWSLLLRAKPACIFHDVSPPAWSSRRWWRGIWLRVPAGPCCCAPSRRAFFILFLRRHGRLDGSGEKFGCVCPSSPRRRAKRGLSLNYVFRTAPYSLKIRFLLRAFSVFGQSLEMRRFPNHPTEFPTLFPRLHGQRWSAGSGRRL